MSDPVEQAKIGTILGREITPLVAQLHGRLHLSANLSGSDRQAVEVALQMAFIRGANAALAEPMITRWELPWGDQWAQDQGKDGA